MKTQFKPENGGGSVRPASVARRGAAGAGFGLPVLDTYKQFAQPNTGAASSPIRVQKNTPVLSMPLTPWNEGFEAGRVGIQTCPYPVGTSAGWAWSSGYIEGAANAKSTR
jgi:hypothetical protein